MKMMTDLIRATCPYGGREPSMRDSRSRSLNRDGGADQVGRYQFLFAEEPGVWDDPRPKAGVWGDPKPDRVYGFPANHFEIPVCKLTL